MSRIAYYSGIDLLESYRIVYRIYVLKYPDTGKVFYVGKTMKELRERLVNHLSSMIHSGSNKEKNKHLQSILDGGGNPIIEEVEAINGTCYIDRVYASYREYHWMKHYINLGVALSNHVGVKTDTTCREYEKYLKEVSEGAGSYHYYYVGQTPHGVKVFDSEKMEEDGFVFENESPVAEELEVPVKVLTYDPVYDDEKQDYIKSSLEEM